MDNDKKANRLDLILFIIFAFIFVLFILIQLKREFTFPYWACWDRLDRSLETYDTIFKEGNLPKAFLVSGEYPPLVFFITALAYRILGVSIAVTYGISIAFTLILCYLLLLIGRRTGGRMLGWSMMLLGGTAPELLFYSKQFFLLTPMAVFIALSFYLMLKSDYFRDTRNSIFCALALAAGAYTNFTFLFFAVPVAAAGFIYGLVKSEKDHRKTVIRNFSICALISILLPLPWYLGAMPPMLRKVHHQMTLPDALPPSVIENITQNLSFLSGTFYLAGILMILGFILAFFRPRRMEPFLAAIGIGGGFFHLPFFRTYLLVRYMVPFIPFASLLALFWTTRLPDGIRKIIVVLCLIIGLWQAGGWLIPGLPKYNFLPVSTPGPGFTTAPNSNYYKYFDRWIGDIKKACPDSPPLVLVVARVSGFGLTFDGLGYRARELKAYGAENMTVVPAYKGQNQVFSAARRLDRLPDIILYVSQGMPSAPGKHDRAWAGDPGMWEKMGKPYIIYWEGPDKIYVTLFKRKQPQN
ncbi:MAG: glycosyltransferase family 39 protein [Chloroflexi bacterium]|nr:glycosyltransferase family 39 protein [Chloroflexota bacterium]